MESEDAFDTPPVFVYQPGDIRQALAECLKLVAYDPELYFWQAGEDAAREIAHVTGEDLPEQVMGLVYCICPSLPGMRLRRIDRPTDSDPVAYLLPQSKASITGPSPQLGRELTAHQVNGANEQLKIVVNDEPGAGGANHRYEITGFDTEGNASSQDPDGYKSSFSRMLVLFQNGPIKECGVNGITQEALIAILIDRLEGFQRGPYACHDNQMALEHLQSARLWLHKRTLDRLARGVEGTHRQ